MEAKVKSTAVPTAAKGVIKRKVSSASKATMTVCGDLKKKILDNKRVTLLGIDELAGVNKYEMMEIIEMLDAMGTATYNTACALREVQCRLED